MLFYYLPITWRIGRLASAPNPWPYLQLRSMGRDSASTSHDFYRAGTTAPPSCRCREYGMTNWPSGWQVSQPSPTSCLPCWACGWWRGWDAGSSPWAASWVEPLQHLRVADMWMFSVDVTVCVYLQQVLA